MRTQIERPNCSNPRGTKTRLINGDTRREVGIHHNDIGATR
jgi:hypothetical protein